MIDSRFLRGITDFLVRIYAFIFLTLFTLLKIFFSSKKKEVWLIGEYRGRCILDNGYYFYQYCKHQQNYITAYLVIKKSSPVFEALKEDSNVLIYGTLAHLKIFILSNICFYTHTVADFIYRRFYDFFGRSKKLIYLHHGVLGYKMFDDDYRENKNIMDLFIVGSIMELDILTNQEGLNENKVRVTGYPRFDALINNSKSSSRSIVYMPTHRNWISEDVRNTEFFNKIISILSSKRLHDILNSNKTEFYILLHQEMARFTCNFTSPCHNVHIVDARQKNPHELITSGALMITDYSSVSWDFLFLGKPVIFYRFDIEQYLNSRDSYINLYNDIYGPVCFNEEELLSQLEKYLANGFKIEDRYKNNYGDILPVLDGQNCQRVYNAVLELTYNEHG